LKKGTLKTPAPVFVIHPLSKRNFHATKEDHTTTAILEGGRPFYGGTARRSLERIWQRSKGNA